MQGKSTRKRRRYPSSTFLTLQLGHVVRGEEDYGLHFWMHPDEQKKFRADAGKSCAASYECTYSTKKLALSYEARRLREEKK